MPKTRSSKRRILWAVLAVAIGLALAWAMWPKPMAVDMQTIQRGPLQVTLDEEGETRVRERYVVSAPVSGQVLRIELEPGDPVVAGQTQLAILQPAPPSLLDARTQAEAQAGLEAAQAELGLAKAELARSQAELRFARSELARIQRLAAEQIVSNEALDAAQLQVDTGVEAETAAAFAVRTAEHKLAQARATLLQMDRADADQRPITIRSPVEGVVLRRLRESAAVVAAGEPLLEVGDPGQLEIVSDFLSEEAVRIRPGAPVQIDRWGGEQPLSGRVRRIEPAGFTKISALGVEEQRVNVIIDFEDPRDAWVALGDGFRVEVRVVIWESDDVLKVPTSSLFRAETDWAVFVASAGTAQRTQLQIGWRNGLEAEVLSGLAPGDRVILRPGDDIADGVSVEQR